MCEIAALGAVRRREQHAARVRVSEGTGCARHPQIARIVQQRKEIEEVGVQIAAIKSKAESLGVVLQKTVLNEFQAESKLMCPMANLLVCLAIG